MRKSHLDDYLEWRATGETLHPTSPYSSPRRNPREQISYDGIRKVVGSNQKKQG